MSCGVSPTGSEQPLFIRRRPLGGGGGRPEANSRQTVAPRRYKRLRIAMNQIGRRGHNGPEISVHYSDALAPGARINGAR